MASISASEVKILRERTGAGMMDCKQALAENDGDMDAAVDWLRTKGLSAAARKASRVAAEGLVGVAVSGCSAAVVEINSETDFVGRNESFQEFVRTIAGVALTNQGDYDGTLAAPYPGEARTVGEQVQQMVATVGENIQFRRSDALAVRSGVVASYVHNTVVPNLGKIGVLVALESDGDTETLSGLGKQIAMHVAAASPLSLSVDSLDSAVVERERAVLAEQGRQSGKSQDIIAKMTEGRLRKFYEEAVLNEQIYVIDGEPKVSKVVEQAARDVGTDIMLAGFVRFALGEGIEREEEDFAAEVVAQLSD
ncbi:MAG: elongation factor Ts [Alphaproteobacteria bacterium]|nr:elongation factor Ts [Alphaproteobacteria bacterium]